MKIFRNKLKAWEAECERQRNEFTITEFDLNADKHLLTDLEIVVSSL